MDHRIFSRLPSVAERLWSPKTFTSQVLPVDKPRIGRTLCSLRQYCGLQVGPVFPDFCPLPKSLTSASEVENGKGFAHVTAGVDAYGGMSPAGITWRSISLTMVAVWLMTIVTVCAWRMHRKRDSRPQTEDYSGVSYSPVSTEDEEETIDQN